jgi:hypothetical protein
LKGFAARESGGNDDQGHHDRFPGLFAPASLKLNDQGEPKIVADNYDADSVISVVIDSITA